MPGNSAHFKGMPGNSANSNCMPGNSANPMEPLRLTHFPTYSALSWKQFKHLKEKAELGKPQKIFDGRAIKVLPHPLELNSRRNFL